jgi:hypothetical protein
MLFTAKFLPVPEIMIQKGRLTEPSLFFFDKGSGIGNMVR